MARCYVVHEYHDYYTSFNTKCGITTHTFLTSISPHPIQVAVSESVNLFNAPDVEHCPVVIEAFIHRKHTLCKL